jgi:phage gp36-like protein
MAVGTYALISLQELKDHLGITVSTDDTVLERAIDRATSRIESFCGRLIKSRAHQEWYGGNSVRAIRLKQWPVTVVAGVYTGIRTAFTFASTTSSDIRVTISITQEFDGVSTAGATINRTTSAGSTTTSTLSFTTYPDVDSLVAAINALTGVQATTVFNCPTLNLHPRGGGDALSGTVNVTAATVGAEYVYEGDTGVLHIQSDAFPLNDTYLARFPSAYQSVFVRYTAGYATVPDDMKQACCEVASMLYQSRKADRSILSESLGDYSYTRAGASEVNAMLADLLRDYREVV